MKKFKLDRKNGIIFGVCSGISNYVDVDVIIIRILMVIFFSYTFLPYLIMALVAPSDENE